MDHRAIRGDDLESAYLYLRRIEHRIQMVADEQTHEFPEDAASLANVARFSGYRTPTRFQRTAAAIWKPCSALLVLFEASPELTSDGSHMMLRGRVDDPDTIADARPNGLSQPSEVLATVRGWHLGRMAVMRSRGPRASDEISRR